MASANVMIQEDSTSQVSSRRKRGEGKRSVRSSGASPYSTIPLPPCKVCGGMATGFHFGVITCEACKAFFRRALIHKHNYKCIKDNNCNITDRKLGNCSACRFQKCLALGMSKGGVRRGRYSIAIRTQAILDAKAQKAAEESFGYVIESPPSKRQKSNPIETFESDFGNGLQMFDGLLDVSEIANDINITIAIDDRPMNDDENLQYFLYENLLADSSISLSPNTASESSTDSQPVENEPNRKPFVENQELEFLIDAVMSCQEVVYPKLKKQYIQSMEDSHLKIYDEVTQKEELFEDLFGMGKVLVKEFQEVFADPSLDLDDRLFLFNQKGRAMEESIAQYVNFAKLVPGFKNLNPKDVSKLLKAAHIEFWLLGNYMLYDSALGVCSGWDGMHKFSREHMLKFFDEEHIDAIFMYSDRLKALNMSLEEIALTRMIVLTYTDRCLLSDVTKIQSLQEKYLDCLQYYLEKTYTKPAQRLYKIFNQLLSLRDLSYSNVFANKKFLNEWDFVIHGYPLWKEMLTYDGE